MARDDLAEFLEVIATVHEHAKQQGLRKGKGGVSSVSCPKCKTGTIDYSVASFNGHIWGKCTTKDCVRWIE